MRLRRAAQVKLGLRRLAASVDGWEIRASESHGAGQKALDGCRLENGRRQGCPRRAEGEDQEYGWEQSFSVNQTQRNSFTLTPNIY